MSLTKKGGRFLQSYGELQIDKYGLSTATAEWFDPASTPTLVAIGSAHPLWTSLLAERVRARFMSTHWQVEADYAGIIGTPPSAIYELDFSVAEEPIQTHPDFATFAGTAATPLNNAFFDTDGIFVDFKSGDKAGVRSYLAPGAVWRKTIIQTSVPSSIASVGTISTPDGSPPSVAAGRNWLFMGVTYEQRGGVYTVKSEWKLSGARGWDADIY